MNNELKEKIDNYISSFLDQEHVKKYFLLEKMINESNEINALLDDLKTAQKNLALAIGDNDKHEKCLQEYLKLKNEIDSNPLICNYLASKEQIVYELKQLEEDIKELNR